MASRGINRVTLIGNLGRDPDQRTTSGGTTVCTVSIATSQSWKDRNSGEKREKTEWHRVVFFNQLAEIVGRYVSKGSKIFVEGRLQTRKWRDQNGEDRYTTEVVGMEMQILDRAGNGSSRSPNHNTRNQTDNSQHTQQPQQQPQQNAQDDYDDEDFDADFDAAFGEDEPYPDY